MRQASTLVRSLHKMGLGINLGETLFGLVALNPTVKRVSDKSERGRVLNDAWKRFQAVGILAMGVTVAMWRLGASRRRRAIWTLLWPASRTSSSVERFSRASRRRSRAGGSPLVLLHGAGDNSLDWRWVLPALARKHRVYAPDLPGSPTAPDPPTTHPLSSSGSLLPSSTPWV